MDNYFKEKIMQAVQNRGDELISLGEKIYSCPETGFKEFKTSELVAGKFGEIGLEFTKPGNIPGVKATLDTGRKGPGVAILAELDAVICATHPHSDRETGAVHACGHNAQVCAMIGAAMGLLDSGVLGQLAGKIHFIAVPAEEYIEIAFRIELREKGVIRYLGGKPELLYRGFFDDVDLCIMTHVEPTSKKLVFETSSNGCLAKKIKYIGKASHAGIAPNEGINALYAANLGLTAINSIRETFREEDTVRVHPIITKGGDVVNVIPDEVTMETFVRGKTMDAIIKANKRVDRALMGGAIALGAKVEIEDMPGYFPLMCDERLLNEVENAVIGLGEEKEITKLPHGTGSTDLGDLSTLMPVAIIYTGGIQGGLHSSDYRIADKDTVYLLGAKVLACAAAELLWKDGASAQDIIRQFKPIFKSRDEYFEYTDKLFARKLLPENQSIIL